MLKLHKVQLNGPIGGRLHPNADLSYHAMSCAQLHYTAHPNYVIQFGKLILILSDSRYFYHNYNYSPVPGVHWYGHETFAIRYKTTANMLTTFSLNFLAH